jgi:hypothetical protein
MTDDLDHVLDWLFRILSILVCFLLCLSLGWIVLNGDRGPPYSDGAGLWVALMTNLPAHAGSMGFCSSICLVELT